MSEKQNDKAKQTKKKKKNNMYSTPIINTNGKVQKTINDLTAQLKTHFEEKRIQQARFMNYRGNWIF
jgi:hypothetical protein